MSLPRERRLRAALALALSLAAALAFWLPALARSPVPIPLDDVYIHFAFARSTALGAPMQWVPGQGYSSGATSLLYPLLLAPLWALGLRGQALFVGAAAIALAAVSVLVASALRLARPRDAPTAVLVGLVGLGPPLLHWSLWSGMEAALFAGFVGHAAHSLARAERVSPHARARAQRRLGAWLAALAATRPEGLLFAGVFSVAAAHAGATTPALRSLSRTLSPALVVAGLQALAQRAYTGEWAAAGAVRKLVTSDPYIEPAKRAVLVVGNLVVTGAQGFGMALGPWPLRLAIPLLVMVCVGARPTRRLGVALSTCALLVWLATSLNTTARFQHLRYLAPALTCVALAGALGLGELARRGPWARAAGAALGVAAVIGGLTRLRAETSLFARAAANIEQQQVEAARRVRALAPRRVMVNDAGAIPYLAEVPALDGLGLGGLAGLPFARASVHGGGAVLELIERLPDSDRPDLLALYSEWWPSLAPFAREVDQVRIDDNVICGGDTKRLLAVDWSMLAPPGEAGGPERVPSAAGARLVLDALDVADLVSEREHAYAFRRPASGHVVSALARTPATEGGLLRHDAGREHAPSASEPVERWTARGTFSAQPVELWVRTDAVTDSMRLRVTGAGGSDELAPRLRPESGDGTWRTMVFSAAQLAPGSLVETWAPLGARVFRVLVVAAP